jgi:hypothetical protein
MAGFAGKTGGVNRFWLRVGDYTVGKGNPRARASIRRR